MQAAPALNGHLPEAAPAPAGDAARCGVALVGPDPAALGERFMRERLEDRVDYIEARVPRGSAWVALERCGSDAPLC